MELLIKIKTPKGQAKKVQHNLTWIIGVRKGKYTTWVNDEDNEVYWEIKDDIRRAHKIMKNVSKYDVLVEAILGNMQKVKKAYQKIVKKQPDKKEEEELRDLLMNHTKIEIVKSLTKEELDEYNKTWWQRMKEKLKKI